LLSLRKIAFAAAIAAAPCPAGCRMTTAPLHEGAVSRISVVAAGEQEVGRIPHGRAISAGGETLEIYVFVGGQESILFRTIGREALSEYSSLDIREDALIRISFNDMKTSLAVAVTSGSRTERAEVRIPEGADMLALVPFEADGELHVYLVDAHSLAGSRGAIRAVRIELSFGSVLVSEFSGETHLDGGAIVRTCRLDDARLVERQIIFLPDG